MEGLINVLAQDEQIAQLINRIDGGGCPAVISGMGRVLRAMTAAAVRQATERPIVMICADEAECAAMAADVEAFSGESCLRLGTRDLVFYNVESVSRQEEHRRIEALHSMSEGAGMVCASVEAMLLRTMPRERLRESALTLAVGETRDLSELCLHLTKIGYSRCSQVEGPGQFALRGGILDLYSPALDMPVRCEFFGDEIDSMGLFDISDQRRKEMIEKALILPVREMVPGLGDGGEEGFAHRLEKLEKRVSQKGRKPSEELLKNIASDRARIAEGREIAATDRYADLIYPMASALDYIPEDAVVFLCEPARVQETADSVEKRYMADVSSLMENGILGERVDFLENWSEACAKLGEVAVIMPVNFMSGTYPLRPRGLLDIVSKQLPSYGESVDTAVSDISHYMRAGYRTVVMCSSAHRAGIFCDRLKELGIAAYLDTELVSEPVAGKCAVTVGGVSGGLELPELKLAIITEGQLQTQRRKRPRRKKTDSNRQKLKSYADLSPGDLVVHEYHGIGRFVGIFKMPVDGLEKDYIKIAYSGSDSLYVPATQLDLVTKYIGAGDDAPVRLSKMGGADWSRVKSRAKSAAKDMAKELVELYAQRQRIQGHAFSPDSVWQTEFEESFGYQETEDQLRSIEEIKADMERPVPMDRLLCGDVGYGKTEVALRAVMKCVLDGKQAAILVPTTVLAQQHYATARRRFAGYPVEIEVLSRFRAASEVKTALSGLKSGRVDLVIGTHKLLQESVSFKDLGLLVVDEEQRFGVSHKERLKEISKNVDVLTLSATPIPRTLNMAFSGIRDMSTLEEPPQDRQPVQTYVMEFDWNVITDAISRELARGGQVYFLHNRVENIERCASELARRLGDGVVVAAAHGKMDEAELRNIMEQMAEGEIQVLVCTTIIETGIDIPNVNTLIIEDADRLGLAQLHQIRGRVGRSSRRAFAYFTFRRGKVLNEVAEKRLSAIREFAEFNSGFKIAMRDLEIRGAGNLLGAEQSGHMMSVGYDLYLKLLEEAVTEEKGEKPQVRTECSADLAVSANIPERYVPSAEQRMDLYRRIAWIRTEEDADDITDELIDRYGDPPRSVNTLIYIALLRGEASACGITDISQKGGYIRLQLSDFDLNALSALLRGPEYRGRGKLEADKVMNVVVRLKPGKDVIGQARALVRDIGSVMPRK